MVDLVTPFESPTRRQSQYPTPGVKNRKSDVYVQKKNLSTVRGRNSIYIDQVKDTARVAMAEVPGDGEMKHELHEDGDVDDEERDTVSVCCFSLECC